MYVQYVCLSVCLRCVALLNQESSIPVPTGTHEDYRYEFQNWSSDAKALGSGLSFSLSDPIGPPNSVKYYT